MKTIDTKAIIGGIYKNIYPIFITFSFIVIFIIKGGIFMIVFTLFIGFLCLIYQQDRLYKYLKDRDNNYIL